MSALHQQQVAIVGLGLMGGSMALALRSNVGRLVGVDPDERTLAYAQQRGIIDTGTTDLQTGLKDAQTVILAAPVQCILDMLQNRIGGYLRSNTLLIDLGSTKAEICAAMGRLPIGVLAMGGHPMCGKERSGIEAADPHLYDGRPFVLCPPRRVTPAARQRALELVQAINAVAVEMDAARHDRLVAGISHLPYLLSAALVRTVAEEAKFDPRVWELAAGGFRDTSRLAASDVTVMLDILSTNTAAVARLLALFRMQLAALEVALIAQDGAQLRAILENVREARQEWAEKHQV